MVDSGTPISGYRFIEKIYESSRTLVIRAQRESDAVPVVLKLMRNEYPTFSELVQFRNQYAIVKNLNLPGVVKVYSLETYQNRYVLVLEDFGGVSLKDYTKQQWQSFTGTTDLVCAAPSLPIADFLTIALQVTAILERLHRLHIIHKDIKPANILINPITKQVKLIDFSIASLLPKEIPEIQGAAVLEGTLFYISPEQTGRMNRGIDYRTDYYSLGVTFYELLTGQLPFTTDDRMEVVHCHLAKYPPAAHTINAEIPPIFSAIITKLMAKNAEDRYQSAAGLKADLEQCLHQWREAELIAEFELGTGDQVDQFVLPEKLYGREQEVETLLTAFERVSQGSTEMVLIAGFSGIGKTAVVNEIHKPIVRQRGYFLKGKFDQFQRNIPFSAFVQALRDLVGQLLTESDARLRQWQAEILAAVGNNGQLMVEVVPELERIIGRQPAVPELSGTAAHHRFDRVFQQFIQVFAAASHPLVIFLDDLQWADSASLGLIRLMMAESQLCHLLLIGAYRDNEVTPAHPLLLIFEAARQSGAEVHTLTIPPLDPAHINHLIADTLNCSIARSHPLTTLVYRKTQGNPFFTAQFLKALYEERHIVFNRDEGCWQYDIAQVNALSLTDDVVELIGLQLQRLPNATQMVLKLAACVGNQFDLKTLAIVRQESETSTAADLWSALQEGLILPVNEIYKLFHHRSQDTAPPLVITRSPRYRFLHDRVQQAAYSLIPADQKQVTHLKIGQLLLKNTPIQEREERIFEIVNQLNVGASWLTRSNDRTQLAQLNLMAGRKAKLSTAYTTANNYFTLAMGLLAADTWKSQYALALALYTEATEVSYLKGDFEAMERLGAIVLEHAQSLLETIRVYETQLQAYSGLNRFDDGIALGLTYLESLGVRLPAHPTDADVTAWLDRTQRRLEHFSIDALLDLPPMTHPIMLAAMRILSRLIALSYFGRPNLFPLIACQGILLSVEHGNALDTPVLYAEYSLMLCSPGIDCVVAGYQYGQLAKDLLDRQRNKQRRPSVLNIFYSYVAFWQEPLSQVLAPLQEAYHSGLEVGDLEFAAYALTNYLRLAFCVGQELPKLKPEFERGIEFTQSVRFEGTWRYTCCLFQAIVNLMGESTEPWQLNGKNYDASAGVEAFQHSKNLLGLSLHYFSQLMLNYLFRRIPEAVDSALQGERWIDSIGSHHPLLQFAFYAALAHLAAYDDAPDAHKPMHYQKASAWSDRLRQWASHAPVNFLHQLYLVEAEQYRVTGDLLLAMERYDQAIAHAKTHQYLPEEALGGELATQFYLKWGKEKIAQVYLIDAYYAYIRWGAIAKVEDLETRFPLLLATVLDGEKVPLSPEETVTLTHPYGADHSSLNWGSRNGVESLDLASVMKASQALSREIHLEQLLSILLKVLLENAGAEKCVLMLVKENELVIEAAVGLTQPDQIAVLQAIAVETCPDLPITLINYVKRTMSAQIINEAIAETPFGSDAYILHQQPKSLLCSPILHQGKLLGLLYLENRLATGVFTGDRVEILNLLCSQAAISLENARLYEQAQTYAHQLEQSLINLQQTQLQLVQSEKMSALGNLIAGVAHEINNPVGFLAGNLQPAQNYINELLELLDLYQQTFPNPGGEVERYRATIDLNYLREDLPKLMYSMREGISRIRSISQSLRTFSRSDTDRKVPFNLHDGIDSTILILKHRLKANSSRPTIKIIKQYGELPLVSCFPGQLNQVMMNLLANAIDALEESNQGRSLPEIQANPNCITIQTQAVPFGSVPTHILVRIRDNGVGMSDEIKQKVFNHLFTTKPVGKGTGLGLAIAYQIVVEKHKGTLTVHSAPNHGAEFVIALPVS